MSKLQLLTSQCWFYTCSRRMKNYVPAFCCVVAWSIISILALWHTVTHNVVDLNVLPFSNEVHAPTYVWKFGLAMLTDKHDDMKHLLATNHHELLFDISRFTDIRDGDVVWIRAEQLAHFVNAILPDINHYFSIMIASNTDAIIPLYYDMDSNSNSNSHNPFDQLLGSPFLLCVFAENYDATLARNTQYKAAAMIEAIPLGLDFHSGYQTPLKYITLNEVFSHVHSHRRLFNGQRDPPAMQENRIKDVLKQITFGSGNKLRMQIYVDAAQLSTSSTQYVARWNTAFGVGWRPDTDYHTLRSEHSMNILKLYDDHDDDGGDVDDGSTTTTYGASRKKMYRSWVHWRILNDPTVNASLFFLDNKQHVQYEGFRRRSEFVFALSLLGNGLDCHRTWEALLFGNIVIVQTSPLDVLYAKHDLPVVPVYDFADINQTMLTYWYHTYKHKTALNNAHTRYKLTNNYWMNYIRNKTLHKLDNN